MLKGNIEKDMKSRRILIIFSKLSNGEKVNKKSLCLLFNVSSKTIQRDIDDIRSYISNENYGDYEEIKYNKKDKNYYLISKKEEQLEKEEILILIKILLESRALNKKELDRIINKLMNTLKIKIDINESRVISNMIRNEHINSDLINSFEKVKKIKESGITNLDDYSSALEELKKIAKSKGFTKLTQRAYVHFLKSKDKDIDYLNEHFIDLENEYNNVI